MVLDPHRWLELRRFRSLYESGAMSMREIAKETGLNRRTVSKYLKDPASVAPPKREAAGQRPRRVVDEVASLIDAMLRSEILLKGRVIHERLVQDYGVSINYQRVKLYLQEARPRIAEELGIIPGELTGLHRRFEVVPGAQAQVDWGDEGRILAHVGIPKVYSFHMALSYSRDPFCCFTTGQDLATFFDCHRAAFAHFSGYVGDNSSAVSCCRSGWSLPSRSSDGLAASVGTTRRCRGESHGVARARPGRRLPGVRGRPLRAARDHMALRPLPKVPYVVAQRHLRHVGKDCLVAFDANLYSVPARKVRPRQLVEIRLTKSQISLHSTVPDAAGPTLLAVHPRAVGRGARIVDETHWDGLPTSAGRRVTTGDALPSPRHGRPLGPEAGPLQTLLNRTAAASVEVGRRPLSVYDELTGTRPFTSNSPSRDTR